MRSGEFFRWGRTTRAAIFCLRLFWFARITFCRIDGRHTGLVLGVSLGLLAGYVEAGRFFDLRARYLVTFPSILIAMLIFGVARGFAPGGA